MDSLYPSTVVWVWYDVPMWIQSRRSSEDIAKARINGGGRKPRPFKRDVLSITSHERGEYSKSNGVPCQIIVVTALLRSPGQRPARIIENEVGRTYRYIGIDQRAPSDAAGPNYANAVALAPEKSKESRFPRPH